MHCDKSVHRFVHTSLLFVLYLHVLNISVDIILYWPEMAHSSHWDLWWHRISQWQEVSPSGSLLCPGDCILSWWTEKKKAQKNPKLIRYVFATIIWVFAFALRNDQLLILHYGIWIQSCFFSMINGENFTCYHNELVDWLRVFFSQDFCIEIFSDHSFYKSAPFIFPTCLLFSVAWHMLMFNKLQNIWFGGTSFCLGNSFLYASLTTFWTKNKIKKIIT